MWRKLILIKQICLLVFFLGHVLERVVEHVPVYNVPIFFDFLAFSNDNTIYVNNCFNKSTANQNPWARSIAFEMSAYAQENLNLELIWQVYRVAAESSNDTKVDIKYSKGYNFVISSYSLTQGFYRIIVLSVEDPEYKAKDSCFLRIKPERSYAFITGGSVRQHRPYEVIIADGSASMDYSNPEYEVNSLIYYWTCSQKNSNEFCPHNESGKAKEFIIPKEYVVEGEQFFITLMVENEDNYTSTTVQQINVRSNVKHLQMSCKENCPPWARSDKVTKLVVICVKYCLDPCKGIWSFSSKSKLRLENGNNCTSDVCSYHVSMPEIIEFTYNCQGANISGGTSLEINFKPNPKLICAINPEKGNSYSTEFQVGCRLDPENSIQTIAVFLFDEKEHKGINEFITIWSPPVNHTFSLPDKTTQILVRAYVHSGIYSQTVLNVTVTKEFQADDSEKFIIRTVDLYMGNKEQSVKYYLIRNYNSNKALSKIRSFWRDVDLVDRKNDSHVDDLRILMLHSMDDLISTPVLTADNLIQMNNAIKSLLPSYDNNTSALAVKHLSILCKKFSYDSLKLLENKQDEQLQSTIKNIDVAKTLADCAEKIVTENIELLRPQNMTHGLGPINTTEPTVDEVITENYEDYVFYSKKYYIYLEDLEEATSNVLEQLSVMLKIIANSIEHHGSKKFESEIMELSLYKYPGYYFRKPFGNRGVWIKSSSDIQTSQQNFIFKILCLGQNIFWWSPGKFKPTTYVVDISVEDMTNNKVISVFDEPHIISLKMVNDTRDNIKYETFSVSVPASYHKQTKDENYMNEFIRIHRINLFQHQGLFIEFHDLLDQHFYAVTKNFQLPVMADFMKNNVIMVNQDNRHISVPNQNNYDSWFYVGILPHRAMVDPDCQVNQSFKYSVRFLAPVCYRWTFDRAWTRTCVAGTSSKDQITCTCDHLSILAGGIERVKSKVLTMDNLDLELILLPQWEIFYCVFALFSAYCILLLYGKRKHEIYYAADNDYNDRYAYLIVVRTGRFRQLTSRIVIKIKGAKGESLPHVLNYPDPYHRIFQAGSEDWIVITTPGSLGDIKHIELWHDSFGLKPTWYCKDIGIHDLQTKENWMFKINQVISVSHEYKVKIAPLGAARTKRKKLMDILTLSSDHYIWNIFADWIHHKSSYIERLLFLYSRMIVPLLIAAIWHGFPEMQNLDSLDPYSNYYDGYVFLIGFASSLISFIIHSAQKWCYPRNSMIYTIPLIVCSNSLLIQFGFWIPYYSSVRIIIAWAFGFILDMLIYSNVLKTIRKLIFGSKLVGTSKGISYENILKEIEVQRETLHTIFESIFILKLHQMAVPLQGKKFRHRKRQDKRRTNLAQQLKDLVMFGIYIIILHAVVSNEKDHLVYQDHAIMSDMFKGKMSRTMNLYDNLIMADVYNYINSTLIESLHNHEWYTNFVNEEPGELIGRSHKYIGVARIRQQRVKPYLCNVDFLPKHTMCGPVFSMANEDQRTFEDGWKNPTKYLSVRKRMSYIWIYQDSYQTGARPYLGYFAFYPGGGYIAQMGRTRHNSIVNYNIIRSHNWIDRFTRSIFIEFLTYSANYNLFNSVRVVIERDPTGEMNCRLEIQSARMMYVGSELERRSLVYSIVFVIWLIVLFLNRTKLILRDRLSYLKNFWSLLDLIIILISLCTIIIYVERIKRIGELLNTLEKVKHNEFVNYFSLFRIHVVLNVIGSVLVSASTIRLWKLVRFFWMFRLFEKTILLVIKPIGALMLHQLAFLIACAMAAHIFYGENSKEFSSFISSSKTLISIYFNFYNNYSVVTFKSGLPYAGFTLLVMFIIVSKIIFGIYIVIVVSSHLDTKELFSQPQEKIYSFVGYIKEELMFLFPWFRPKLPDHKETGRKKKVIYPKPDKYLYANCLSTTTHSMNAMTAIAATALSSIIHKSYDYELSDKQIVSMLRVCHYHLSEHIYDDHKEFFYKAKCGKTMKVIDSKRIDKAKHVAEIILGVSQKMERKQKMNRMMILRHNLRDLDKAAAKLDLIQQSLQNIKIDEN